MKFKWLHNASKADTVFVFFSGWGMDARIVKHLRIDANSDVLFVQDYRSLDDRLPSIEHYQKRYLIAWSFGVAAYCQWQTVCSSSALIDAIFDYKVAINGTPNAVHRQTGIAPKVMQKTIDYLSVKSYQLFLQKCFHPLSMPKTIYQIAEKSELIQLKQELQSIQRWQEVNSMSQDGNERIAANTVWDKVWLSRQDAVFSQANLQRAWQQEDNKEKESRCVVEYIDAPHMPFFYWENWCDIIV